MQKIQIRLKVLLLQMSLPIENQSVLLRSESNPRQCVCVQGYSEGIQEPKGTTQVKSFVSLKKQILSHLSAGCHSRTILRETGRQDRDLALSIHIFQLRFLFLFQFHFQSLISPLLPPAPLSLFWIKQLGEQSGLIKSAFGYSVFLDTHLRASHHTRFGTLAEHPGLPAADDVITQKGQSWRAASVSPKKHRNDSMERDQRETERRREEREGEVHRPKHGKESMIQVFGAALTGRRRGCSMNRCI